MTDLLESIFVPPCAGCGTCCRLVVELAPGDAVPAEFVVEHEGVRCMEQRGNGACVALDDATKLCTIYDQRPQVCRTFERGSGLCRSVLARYARVAPAIGDRESHAGPGGV